jgi:V8-like Glu-specific endopeptidase
MDIDTDMKKLLYSTVKIDVDMGDGTEKTGTGFIFNGAEIDGTNKFAPILISNKHVLDKTSSRISLHFIKNDGGKPVAGNKVIVDFNSPENVVVEHSDENVDIAAIRLGSTFDELAKNNPIYFSNLDRSAIPTTEELLDFDALEELVFIGYPNGIFDAYNLIPVIRRAVTATPLQLDYEGEPMFLIDGSVFPGSSGSPVFLVNLQSYKEKGVLIVGQRILLLGVLASVYMNSSTGEIIKSSNPDSVTVDTPNNLGKVFKWEAVSELIDKIMA